MRIVAKRTLRSFWNREPRAEQPLKAWYAVATKADWMARAAVKRDCRSASLVGSDRVVFGRLLIASGRDLAILTRNVRHFAPLGAPVVHPFETLPG